MNLLNPEYFDENRNGRVVEAQLALLKAGASPWVDLALLAVTIVFAWILRIITIEFVPPLVILGVTILVVLGWLSLRLPTFIRYYGRVLPDVRANNLARTTAKLENDHGYVLQGDDVRLALPDGPAGLVAGNLYEVYSLPRAKLALSAHLAQEASETEQAAEYTRLIGKSMGTTPDELAGYHEGWLSLPLRLKLLWRNWFFTLAMTLIAGGFLFQIFAMWDHPAFVDDAIIYTICQVGLMAFLFGVILLYSNDARGVLAALIALRLEQKEGRVSGATQTITTRNFRQHEATTYSRRTLYYIKVSHSLSLEVSKTLYDLVVNGLTCRVFYTSFPKYLLGLEVMKVSQPSHEE